MNDSKFQVDQLTVRRHKKAVIAFVPHYALRTVGRTSSTELPTRCTSKRGPASCSYHRSLPLSPWWTLWSKAMPRRSPSTTESVFNDTTSSWFWTLMPASGWMIPISLIRPTKWSRITTPNTMLQVISSWHLWGELCPNKSVWDWIIMLPVGRVLQFELYTKYRALSSIFHFAKN